MNEWLNAYPESNNAKPPCLMQAEALLIHFMKFMQKTNVKNMTSPRSSVEACGAEPALVGTSSTPKTEITAIYNCDKNMSA